MQKPPFIWTNLLLFSITGLATLVLVPYYALTVGFDTFEWLSCILLMGYCGISITAGYHRLWSHKAYKAHPILRVIFALGGACALQNDVLHWASDHRRHHRYVDNDDKDPYSAGRGFWYSHMGWMLRHYESGKEDFSNVSDLEKDPIVMWQARNYLSLLIIMNIGLPAFIGYLHGNIWASVLLSGLLRLTLSQQVTYFINSLAHIWGERPYSTANSSRDNGFIALLTYGEGYHNFHHAFQWDYRNGIKWWHYDPTKWTIRLCSWLGLAKDLKLCTIIMQEKARLDTQYEIATKKCQGWLGAEKWRLYLEKEYQLFASTLNNWSQLRQQWVDAKSKQLQEKISKLDKAILHKRYQEMQRSVEIQRKRWQDLLHNFSQLQTATSLP